MEKETQPSLPDVTSVEDGGERKTIPVSPNVSTLPHTFHDAAGYNLTVGMLAVLFIVIFAFLYILTNESHQQQLPSKEALQLLIDCIKPGADKNACPPERMELAKSVLNDPAVAAYREFWKTMFERIVGTTLLPIVTALLGFLFGAQGRNAPTATPAANKKEQ